MYAVCVFGDSIADVKRNAGCDDDDDDDGDDDETIIFRLVMRERVCNV